MIKIQESEKNEIIKKYIIKNYSCRKIAKEHNKSHGFIRKLLRLNEVKIKNRVDSIRRYSLNQNYFEKINTEMKAYFLGLMYADGCNFAKNNCASISLQERDAYILDVFSKELDTDRPLQFINLQKNHPNWSNSYTLAVKSSKICQDLSKLGCIPKKSLVLTFPNNNQVPDNLLNHFMRGYLDGDGCISSSKKTMQWSIAIVSSIYFCTSLKDLTSKIIGINSSIKRKKDSELKGNDITKVFYIGGNFQVKKFLDWIYKESTIHLNRKYVKYLELCDWIKNQKPKQKDPNTGRYIKKLMF